MSTTVRRTNATTATAHSANTSKTFGANPTYIYVNDASGGVGSYAYVFFPAPLPRGATLVSATLEVEQAKAAPGSVSMYVERVNQAWTASRVSWSRKPTVSGSAVTATGSPKSSPGAGTKWSFAVGPMLSNLNTSTPWYGFRIRTNTNTTTPFYGKGAKAPKLTLVYKYLPSAPVFPFPGGAASDDTPAIGVPRPTLGFLVEDDVDLTSFQVQMSTDATPNWTTPTWDSGEVVSTNPQLTLEGTTAPALTVGQSIWWRVRVRSEGDLWSPYTAAIRYKYTPLPMVAMVSPPPGSAGTVGVSSPTVSWSVTGGTQKFFNVRVDRASAGGGGETTFLWESGRRAGTQTSIVIPPGIITRESPARYGVLVEVYDGLLRDSTTDSTEYAYDGTLFSYATTTAVAGPTNLTSTNFAPRPHVRLQWDYASTPAATGFEVLRNGVVVATDLEPADLLLTGTTYRWTDRSVPPDATHTWEVRAIVGQETSKVNPTVQDRLYTGLLWISDPETDRYAAVAGESPVSIGLTEQGQVFDVLGSKYKVRVTGALGGYSGKVVGKLCGECMKDGTTSAQLQTLMHEFREDVGRTLVLHFEKLAVPVVIYNVSTYPLTGVEFGRVYGVEFDFHEVRP